VAFLGGQKNADDEYMIPDEEELIFKGFGKCCTLPRRDIDCCSVTYNSLLVDVVGEFP
jgi:hypothetical protein